jgi:DNA-binding GntR family transcriptional regulator
MVNTKITIRQAINQVSDREWTNHKNGKGSIKNAQVFEKYYGHESLLNHLATEDVRNFKHHCRSRTEL